MTLVSNAKDHPSGVHFKVALPAPFSQSFKVLSGTNTLACFAAATLLTNKEVLITLTPGW
jgi:hypothetical protein